MLSAVERYQLRLRAALARYFPRTTAYLRAEREAALALVPVTTTLKGPSRQSKRASQAQPKVVTKPSSSTAAGKKSKRAIYGPTLLAVTAAQSQAMRERVGAAVQAGLLSPPSDEQWAMILTRQPLSRIFAGAGSGKSTTLVLRVVFMLCHVGIAPSQLTVISFTNASCAQLREQLLTQLGAGGIGEGDHGQLRRRDAHVAEHKHHTQHQSGRLTGAGPGKDPAQWLTGENHRPLLVRGRAE